MGSPLGTVIMQLSLPQIILNFQSIDVVDRVVILPAPIFQSKQITRLCMCILGLLSLILMNLSAQLV